MLAAAICAGAQFIVTFNLRDFSADTLAGFGIEAVHPDTFLEQQFESNEGVMVRTARRYRANLRKPPKSAEEYLGSLWPDRDSGASAKITDVL